jgi:hypothetical protein
VRPSQVQIIPKSAALKQSRWRPGVGGGALLVTWTG